MYARTAHSPSQSVQTNKNANIWTDLSNETHAKNYIQIRNVRIAIEKTFVALAS